MHHTAGWPTTHETLLRQIRDPENEVAWRHFVDLYLPVIYRYSRRRGLQDADAENVAQDVFAVLSRSIRSLEYNRERGRFRNWLGLITHQRILRHWDHGQRPRDLGLAPGDEVRLDGMAREVDGEWTELMNARIYSFARERVRPEFDGETWQVFEEVWEKGQNPHDVAVRLGRKPAWVYQAKFRVLQRLKQQVIQLCDDETAFQRLRTGNTG